MFEKDDTVIAKRRVDLQFIVVRRVDDTNFIEVAPVKGSTPTRFFMDSDLTLVKKADGTAVEAP